MKEFELEPDNQALAWMAAHPATRWVVGYDVHLCCGGGKICTVTVREVSANDRADEYATATLPDGASVMVDTRAARRLPSRFGLTVRGLGPLKHLDLVLSGDEWGELLYS